MAEIFLNMAERIANVAAETVRDYTGIEGRVQVLKTEVQNLRNRAADVVSVLEEEEIRTGKKRKREVKNWLADVGRKKIKCDSLDQEVKQTRFYNIYSRLHLGNHIKEMSSEVEKLIEASKFPDGLFLEIHKTKGKPLATTEWKGQQSLDQNFNTVWSWIMNSVDSRIGIYGMGGVGKTTLAMRIHDYLLKDPKFKGHVYWVHVSQDSNISKLQNDIAGVIKLDLSTEDNDNQRAARIFEALKRRKRFVLVLDDMWNPFEVQQIGIPVGGDGSKLLITSRSIDVCYRIGCQKNLKKSIFSERRKLGNCFMTSLAMV